MNEGSLTTKRLLVAVDFSEPEIGGSDFLVPVVDGDRVVLWGLRSKSIQEFGEVVFIGREITMNDLFARLVESGRRIPSVSDTIHILGCYLEQVRSLKFGHIVQIASDRPTGVAVLLQDKWRNRTEFKRDVSR